MTRLGVSARDTAVLSQILPANSTQWSIHSERQAVVGSTAVFAVTPTTITADVARGAEGPQVILSGSAALRPRNSERRPLIRAPPSALPCSCCVSMITTYRDHGVAGAGVAEKAAWAGLLAHAARAGWRAAGWLRQRRENRLRSGFVVLFRSGVPYEIRTRVTAVKGRCPGPLDERDKADANAKSVGPALGS